MVYEDMDLNRSQGIMNPAYMMGKWEESLIHIMLPCYSINDRKNKFSSHHAHCNVSGKISELKLEFKKLIINLNRE